MTKRNRTCGQTWSESETELLLALVQENSAIWDPKLLRLKKFNNPVWDEIGVQLSRASSECSQKWTALKTYYRQELRKETYGQYVCNWRHKNAMQFYLPFIDRNNVSNLN